MNLRIRENWPRNVGWSMFVTRLLGALFLVFSTYNPSGFSIWHWIRATWPEDWLLLVPILFAYFVAYVLTLRVTYRSLRFPGILLTIAMIGAVIWIGVSAGVIPLADGTDFGILVLFMFGGLIAVGLCWSAAYFSLTGQVSTDDLTA